MRGDCVMEGWPPPAWRIWEYRRNGESEVG